MQLWFWPLRRLQGLVPRAPRPVPGGVASERREQLATAIVAWGPGDDRARIERAGRIAAGQFRFLNHVEQLQPVAWQPTLVNRLWSYHLHYFAYAVDLAWAFRLTGEARFVATLEQLIAGWIDSMGSGRGVGWEPAVISHRITNWCYALLLAWDGLTPEVRDAMVRSMLSQLSVLEARLELHLQGNHLQKNYSALGLGGLLFEGPAAARWRDRYLPILWDEFLDQVREDGGHAERSPMYHGLALVDFLEMIGLVRAAGFQPATSAVDRAGRMWDAWLVLGRPNGALHLFNDSANHEVPSPAYLNRLAELTLGVAPAAVDGLMTLPQSGFYGYADHAGKQRLLIDAGAPAPVHQPGHAHCSALSLELDLFGAPCLTDSGVSGYDGDPLREYARSTRAHNTVQIDGREQSEMWGTFRVGRRAVMRDAKHTLAASEYSFHGACSPFHDLSAVHRRDLTRISGVWTISDRVEGAVGRPVASFFHFHPDFSLVPSGEGVVAHSSRGDIQIEFFGIDRFGLERGNRIRPQGWYCPAFGVAIEAAVIELFVARNDGRPFGIRMTSVVPSP